MNFWQTLPKPFTVLAPMEGVTDTVFREIITQAAKPDVLFTEFTNVEAILPDRNKFADRSLMFTNIQHPIVAQIWGLDPEKFFQASQKLAKLGFDGIDINLGCPVHDVVKKGACSGMIGNYPAVSKIIQACQAGAPNLPISVKTRLGQNIVMTEEWATFLLQQNLASLTLHGRTAIQKSHGLANWDEIAKAVQIRDQLNSSTVIIGNGDIKNYAQVLEVRQIYGVDGVMIGRGVFDNPWVFDPAGKPHSTQESLQLMIKHLELFDQIYAGVGHYESLKKYFSIYVQGFPGAKELRTSLMSTHSIQEAVKSLTTIIVSN